MNKDQMKKSLNARVQLRPIACRVDENKVKLSVEDDDWLVQNVSDEGVRVKNLRTHHTVTLAYDHIHHYTSNGLRSQGDGISYAFFTLLVQVFLLPNNKLEITPTRPGEAVEPLKSEEKEGKARIGFDDFINARSQKQRDAEKLKSEVTDEWLRLKEKAEEFALRARPVGRHTFKWIPVLHAELLVLNYSSAMFIGPGQGLTSAPTFMIYIDRKPPEPGSLYVNEKPVIRPTKWNLSPSVENGEFQWTIRETAWRGSTEELVVHIAKSVTDHYDEYKAKYPQAV